MNRLTALFSRQRHAHSAVPEASFIGWARVALTLASLTLAATMLTTTPAQADDFVLVDPSAALYYDSVAAIGGNAHLHKDSVIAGTVVGGADVHVHEDTVVEGDVTAAGQVKVHGSVLGIVTEGADTPTLPALGDEAALRALADRTLEGDAVFDSESVDEVVVVTGTARFEGVLRGRGTVIALAGIDISDAPTGGGAAWLEPGSRLSLVTPGDLRVGASRHVAGALRAGGDLHLAKETRVDGVVVADGQLQLHKESTLHFVLLDDFAPVAVDFVPAAAALVADQRPTIAARFDDDLSQVDPSSVVLEIDGEAVAATATSAGVTYVPTADLGPGDHVVTLRFVDHAGRAGEATWSFRIDTTAPTVRFAAPNAEVVRGIAAIDLVLDLDDSGVGLGADALSVVLDGAPVACTVVGTVATCAVSDLASGRHTAVAQVVDRAGNSASATRDFDFFLDTEAPTVSILSPADGTAVAVGTLSVDLVANDDVGLESLALNGVDLSPVLGAQTVSVDLIEGVGPLTLRAVDRLGRSSEVTRLVTFDADAPSVTVLQPTDGSRRNGESTAVVLEIEDFGGVATATVTAGGTTVAAEAITSRTWRAEVPLQPGANVLGVEVTDRAGNASTTQVAVERFVLPEVSIDAPIDLDTLAGSTVDVEGAVSDETSTVTVNGVVASVGGGRFVATGVPLIEGGNLLTATAVASDGHAGTATINVVRDSTAPRLEIENPRQGSVLIDSTVTVTGLVNDIVAGTVNAEQASVTVAGQPATVANRGFVAEGVSLQPGQNDLVVEAVDASGNRAQRTLRLWRETQGPSIHKISGDRQSGVAGTALSAPLVAEVRDVAGQPAPGWTVLFKVRTGDGAFADGSRRVAVTTDGAGRAAIDFVLGGRAGAGAQAVEALVVGAAGDGVFTFEVAAGDPASIVVDAGDQQLGIAGRSLPRPLVATVIDADANRLAGVPVTFRRIGGDGGFADGALETTVVTDSDGRAIVPYRLGDAEGVTSDVVQAMVDGWPEAGDATFVASSLVAGEPAETAIVGVVVDNSNVPVPDVTLRVLGSDITTMTDAAGRFRLAPAPVGTLKLIVDGSTTSRAGAWPDLEYVVTTVPGRDNDIGLPIYLLPLDLGNAVSVSETRGGTIELPEVPGFALEIEPGSATFPSGLKSGMVSVTAVHGDKVPMVPNFGQQPQLIVTIQPAGTRFDPPARLTLPNVEGLAAGQITEMYSFDHDLGHFVSIGPARVSEDGRVITAAPGVGVLKAGWHCGGDPSGSGTAFDCPECQKCENDDCVPDDSASPGGIGADCFKVGLGDEIETASNLLQNALNKLPYVRVENLSVDANVSAESCSSCCEGSKLSNGKVKGTGSITASVELEGSIPSVPIPEWEVEKSFLGVRVEFEVKLSPLEAFIRGTPSISLDLKVERDRCAQENCVTVQGCGAGTLTIGGQSVAKFEVEVEGGIFGDEKEIEVGAKAEISTSAPLVARVSYSAGGACDNPASSVDGCLGDITGDIILEVDDFFETSWQWKFREGTPGCECG